MTRRKDIEDRACEFDETKLGNAYLGFVAGAIWADANPVAKCLECTRDADRWRHVADELYRALYNFSDYPEKYLKKVFELYREAKEES